MAPKKTETLMFPRPRDNSDLFGHTEVKRAFIDAWNKRSSYPVHPVWLLSGPRGIGKATLAYNLTRHIFSDLYGYDVTQQLSSGGIGDLFVVDSDSNLSQTKSISIDTIRNVLDKLQMTSMSESWRVIIIDAMDDLSRDTPNALLKMLEEPPQKTIFFLIVHSLDRVLPTIRSRSRIEKMRPLSDIDLRMLSAKFLPNKELSTDLIKISGGSFGRIAALISTGAADIFESVLRIVADKTSSPADYLALAKRIAKFPENLNILLDVIHYFGLAELYPDAARALERADILHLDSETVAFKIITEIVQCL